MWVVSLVGLVLGGGMGWEVASYITRGVTFHAVVIVLAGGLIGAGAPWALRSAASRLGREFRRMGPARLRGMLLGLLLGLAVSGFLAFPVSLLPAPWRMVLPSALAIALAYLGAASLQMAPASIWIDPRRVASRGEGEGHGGGCVLLDTSVIVDGRIADISRTGFIQGEMLIPRFVLEELQQIADSPDALRRNRGRRGLDMLNRLQKESVVPIRTTDLDSDESAEVDGKLVIIARELDCPIVTNDYNLNRVAALQGVTVLNINELANAVKALFLPGESLRVQVIQEGKEPGQGVGYLDDGTMVVIEEGRGHVGVPIEVTVTKSLQTAAGRMIFARVEGQVGGR